MRRPQLIQPCLILSTRNSTGSTDACRSRGCCSGAWPSPVDSFWFKKKKKRKKSARIRIRSVQPSSIVNRKLIKDPRMLLTRDIEGQSGVSYSKFWNRIDQALLMRTLPRKNRRSLSSMRCYLCSLLEVEITRNGSRYASSPSYSFCLYLLLLPMVSSAGNRQRRWGFSSFETS